MQRELKISSVRDRASLTLTRLGPDVVRADFVSPAFTACVPKVRLLSSLDPIAFFQSLATSWRGWSGAQNWESLERQLVLSATHDSLGHVSLRVRLHESPGISDWIVEGTLELEAGQLEAIARDANDALGASSAA